MGAQAAKTWTIVLAMAVMGLMASQASGVTVNVDGNPDDWGIVLAYRTSADWVPDAGIQGTWGGGEDWVGGCGYLNPGWGGQGYDAEAIYFTYDAHNAYFAVVTGFPPTGRSCYDAGDIAIDMLCDGTWDFGIETTGDEGHIQGGLYATDNADWMVPYFGVSKPSELKAAATDLVAGPPDSQLVYLNTAYGGEHYFIEASVPLDALPLPDEGATELGIHWTMACGNDAVNACVNYCPPPHDPQSVIPEPATCTMLGSGLLAALALRVRRRRKRKEKSDA